MVPDRAAMLICMSLLLPVLTAAQAPNLQARPAPPAASGVPSRPLLGEMEKAEVGSAATVHTADGSGPGMVLASSQEVLASLHLVLTGKHRVAPRIAVDITTPPQRPVKDIAASVVAQDPGDDLVLLKLARPVPLAAPMAAPAPVAVRSAVRVASPSPEPSHVPLAEQNPTAARIATARAVSRRSHRSTAASRRPPPVAVSELAIPVAPGASSEQSFYVTGEPGTKPHHAITRRRHVKTRVIDDGPLPQ